MKDLITIIILVGYMVILLRQFKKDYKNLKRRIKYENNGRIKKRKRRICKIYV